MVLWSIGFKMLMVMLEVAAYVGIAALSILAVYILARVSSLGVIKSIRDAKKKGEI